MIAKSELWPCTTAPPQLTFGDQAPMPPMAGAIRREISTSGDLGRFVAPATRPDVEERAVGSRFRRYPVTALTEVVTPAALVVLSAGSRPGLRARLGGLAHTLWAVQRQIAFAVLRALRRRQVRPRHPLPAHRQVHPELELLIRRQ